MNFAFHLKHAEDEMKWKWESISYFRQSYLNSIKHEPFIKAQMNIPFQLDD